MPLIEELPLTNPTRITPGWALVPDTQLITALEPGKRSRASVSHRAGAGFTAKQQKATEARLAKLEKENHQDVTIALPKRERDRGGKKMSSNVRRILTYQRNFGHYLADELALAQAGVGITAAAVTATPMQGRRKGESAATGGTSRKMSAQQLKQQPPMQPPPRPKSSGTTTTTSLIKSESSSIPNVLSHLLQNPTTSTATDPLLKPLNLPKPPSATVMATLLAEPALSYNAARSTLDSHTAELPARHFCGACGYWGKVRCRACGAGRTCGLLECYKAHREVCEGLLR